MGAICSAPADQTAGSMRRIEQALDADADEMEKLSFREPSNKRISPIGGGPANGSSNKGGAGRGGDTGGMSVTMLKGLLDDELADVEVNNNSKSQPLKSDGAANGSASPPRPHSLRIEANPKLHSPSSFKKARTMTSIGGEAVKRGMVRMASKAGNKGGSSPDGSENNNRPVGQIVRGMSQRISAAPQFLFNKRVSGGDNERIEKQLATGAPNERAGSLTNSGHFARNRWGALKSNLTTVMVAEQRRTFREGKMIVVEESGVERPANSAEIKLGPSSPGQEDRQQGGGNDNMAHHRTKKKLSFSESRFTRAVSQRKKGGGAAAAAAAARHRQISRMVKRGNR